MHDRDVSSWAALWMRPHHASSMPLLLDAAADEGDYDAQHRNASNHAANDQPNTDRKKKKIIPVRIA